MRRPARHLFTLCSAASLVLFAVAAVWWARSYLPEHVYCRAVDGRLTVMFLSPEWSRLFDEAGGDVQFLLAEVRAYQDNRAGGEMFGFEWVWGPPPDHRHRHVLLGVPFPALLIVLAVAPMCWWAAYRRRRHAARLGLCAQCGYDLRATPGRCPECGAAAAASGFPA